MWAGLFILDGGIWEGELRGGTHEVGGLSSASTQKPALDAIFIYQYWGLAHYTWSMYMGLIPPPKKQCKPGYMPESWGSLGWQIGFFGWAGKRREKKGYDKCHSPFLRRTGWASHFLGPPLCCPSPIPPSSRHVPAHIPLERVWLSSVLRIPEWLWLSPHPSKEGRGSSSGFCLWLGPSWGVGKAGGGRGMRKDEPKSTMMRLMAALNSNHPHR